MSSRAVELPVGAPVNASSASIGRLVAWTFGLAPVLLFLLTWSENLTILQRLTRGYAFPVLAAELAITFISFREGFRLRDAPPLPLALLTALGLIAWATAATAASPVTAMLRTATWTIHVFFALAIVNLWYLRMLDLKQHARAVLAGFLLVFGMLIAFVATTEQSDAQKVHDLPAFSNVRWFGEYVVGAIGLCAMGFLRRDRFSMLAAAAAFALAFWTGARGAVVAPLVGIMLCTILFPEFRSMRVWLLFVLSGLAGLALAFGLDTLVPFGNRGPDSIVRFGSSGRIELWQHTFEKILERSLFGHGDGQFRFAYETFTVAQPHNVVLQVLHAWGIVGGLLCLALAVWAAPRFLRARGAEVAPFRYATLAIAAHSLIDGTLYHVQSTSLFFLCCAAAIAAGLPKGARSG